MSDYAELRAALEQKCSAILIDDPDAIRALLAERDALIAALEALMGEQSGGPKPCGHDYECVCAGTLLLSALAQGES